MTLFEKWADPEDGRWMSQNNHFIGVWMPFLKNRTQSRRRWGSKVKWSLILQISPEIEASGSCCLVAKSCLTLRDPMSCSTPSFLYCLPGFAQTHVHWVGDAIPTISSSVTSFSSCPQSSPTSGSFPVSQLFASGGQSIGASLSASILQVNIQGWFPLGWTGFISLLSKGLSRLLQHHSLKASTLWCSAFFIV